MTDATDNKKGRPTPKRKEAEAARKVSSLAPASTKAEKKRAKDAARAARISQRAAYLRGDENALPLRDKGPVRKFVRNFVDARRSVGEYFLPVIFIVLFLTLIPSPIFQVGSIVVMYSVLLISVIDGIFLGRKIKREVASKFPGAEVKGLAMYGWLRSTQMRRMRTPKPSIKAGESF
ncbi:unannotated protein [freshwater metagenome]|jgi:hypothetical protein|uniref:Unannotated protein n=1 Tax=freshwater metagenome TaxID=449393 RepID=A0A6J7BEZ0_9ZZZZ|nr:DUF3043 domain-containing protein [Actinomycetota bacterium]MSX60631.1 DUF3043 domain-containing protein [Actinomycetota bacterium]MTA94271.1 DUF3043 domain-containing protein [Actinomycetota bacterium]MTB30206.1 DUF3043 domain-containing protein [Actinomycetota bacterium]